MWSAFSEQRKSKQASISRPSAEKPISNPEAPPNYRKEARTLKESEMARLSRAWFSNAEVYLELSPRKFEDAIAELFRALGYRVRQTPYSNDGGKDAIAYKDGKKYLIECKRYAERVSVGRPPVQQFLGVMHGEGANGGFFISTGVFTKAAKQYAKDHGIILYDRSRLPKLVNKGYGPATDISIVRVMCIKCGAILSVPLNDNPTDMTCPDGHRVSNDVVKADLGIVTPIDAPHCRRCGSVMRICKRPYDGGKFWGCPRFPQCSDAQRILPHQMAQIRAQENESVYLDS